MTAINNVDMEGFFQTKVSPPDHLKKDEYRSICFSSLNSQHCQAATCNARSELAGKKDYFLLLQEPFLRGGKVAEFEDLNPVFTPGTRPRAATVNAPKINVWFCPEFSGRDICTVQWLLGNKGDANNNTQRVFIASVYLDITAPTDEVFPEAWVKLTKFCYSCRLPLIAGVDTNTHSVLWGNETNTRGEIMEEFIAMSDLVVENVVRTPTFSARGTSTCIDVTLSMNLIPLCITGWKVCPDDTLLDHKRITFEVKLKAPAPRECRLAISKANWNLLRWQLNWRYDEPTFITQRWLDRAVKKLERDINWALTKACPTKTSAAP